MNQLPLTNKKRDGGERRSADQGTNIRLRLRCSFRLLSFGYVLNDHLRLTQPIRAAHLFDETRNLMIKFIQIIHLN